MALGLIIFPGASGKGGEVVERARKNNLGNSFVSCIPFAARPDTNSINITHCMTLVPPGYYILPKGKALLPNKEPLGLITCLGHLCLHAICTLFDSFRGDLPPSSQVSQANPAGRSQRPAAWG
jgi:hypothetical protein